MAEATTTTPATPAAFDPKAMQDAIAAGITAALKPVTDELAALKTAQATAAPATTTAKKEDAGKSLTREEMLQLLDERDTKRSQASNLAQQRQQFAADKLKGLPPSYAKLLGDDPAKWAAEEQSLRAEYRGVLEASGVKVPDVGGDKPGGVAPANTVDIKKLSGVQAIAQGLKDASTQGPTGVAERQAAAAAAARSAAGK